MIVKALLAKCYYSFNGPIILLTEHMVKPAGASCDFMRVLALWFSLGNAQVVMPTSSPLHPGTRLAKPAFSVSGHELFRPAVDASVCCSQALALSFRRCSLFLQNWARDSQCSASDSAHVGPGVVYIRRSCYCKTPEFILRSEVIFARWIHLVKLFLRFFFLSSLEKG